MNTDERNPMTAAARSIETYRYHMTRMWTTRHESPAARSAVRDNIRGQQATRAYAARVGQAV